METLAIFAGSARCTHHDHGKSCGFHHTPTRYWCLFPSCIRPRHADIRSRPCASRHDFKVTHFQQDIKSLGILIRGGCKELKCRVLRIGHVGCQAQMSFMAATIEALGGSLRKREAQLDLLHPIGKMRDQDSSGLEESQREESQTKVTVLRSGWSLNALNSGFTRKLLTVFFCHTIEPSPVKASSDPPNSRARHCRFAVGLGCRDSEASSGW